MTDEDDPKSLMKTFERSLNKKLDSQPHPRRKQVARKATLLKKKKAAEKEAVEKKKKSAKRPIAQTATSSSSSDNPSKRPKRGSA